MEKISLIFTRLFCAVLFLPFIAFAQEKQMSEWMRVQSDDGEFSIEVPVAHNYFYDKDGFLTAKDSNNYKVQQMNLLNAYHEETLISFESYKAKKGALEAFYEDEMRFPKDLTISNFKRSNTTIKQIIAKTENYYYLRQYFNSKSNIYILTVASKNGENATMKRFLDSVVFKPDTKERPNADAVLFSSLQITPVELVTVKKVADVVQTAKTEDDSITPTPSDVSKMVVIRKPSPAYTDAARMKAVQGIIRLRLTFNENGFIPKIEVVKSLPEGLLRQTVFAVLRFKFLPQEKAGKVVSTIRTVEYNFVIY